jgi:hypothetical protein
MQMPQITTNTVVKFNDDSAEKEVMENSKKVTPLEQLLEEDEKKKKEAFLKSREN